MCSVCVWMSWHYFPLYTHIQTLCYLSHLSSDGCENKQITACAYIRVCATTHLWCFPCKRSYELGLHYHLNTAAHFSGCQGSKLKPIYGSAIFVQNGHCVCLQCMCAVQVSSHRPHRMMNCRAQSSRSCVMFGGAIQVLSVLHGLLRPPLTSKKKKISQETTWTSEPGGDEIDQHMAGR